ncbi:membrane protein [Bacillus glycinifermentans]|uniref:DUF1294 domain-containing protein n=1 Tax=Bacillus glycinifermentans TaxID=1664069 RepID=A0A0J6F137_9BACI|nr:DUF1294 domain-containing protein [Bacillus glycinifermentans]ATH92728.1 DUF1294 domain-containing protein [Bacillus glycinifermentans]KMM62709.1 membrane protein [Bacillus glycinifermentans]KRT94764.1 hypothetical protein AB447_214010 [Bacillus glycinifermentans]MEC0485553.1 DUF1294 domain-containing protein [Bacillus glycinifermentans]MEC0493499.1 DUF1294 domain-containing protein [Bacillus glycinifermentans]
MHLVLIFFIIINGYGFFMMRADKRRAVQHKWRVPERRIWLTAAAFGSAGVWLGMILVRHKTKHLSFRLGIPFLFVIQAALAGFYFMN